MAVILRTCGCAWWRETGGCSMCGYNEKTSDMAITDDEIISQFEDAWKSYDNHSIVKVYTSGSFIDEAEVPLNIREDILHRVGDAGAKMLFESRPEFVTLERMKDCIEACPDLEVALGLESANDFVLSKSIFKGFTFADYERAAKTALASGSTVRTYLLLKPPYLTEQEAVSEVLNSVSKASNYSRVVTINPVNVQRRTRVEKLWRNWAYRPPWLWSVIEVLREAEHGDSLLLSSLVGAGSERGAHNCGSCDQDVIKSIEGFNLTQDEKKLDKEDCSCKEKWREYLSLEKFSISAGDHERFFQR